MSTLPTPPLPSAPDPRTVGPVDSAQNERDHYRRQLEAIAENATLALFIMDARQQCTYMNPAAERLTGFTLGEVHGRALHDVIHHTRPDGTPYPLSECPIDQAFPKNMREQGEEIFVHRDGTFYEVAFTASPIREAGRTVGTVIEVRDIRDEKRRERERERLLAELAHERARLADVFRQAPVAVAVLRGRVAADLVYETVNPRYEEILPRARPALGRRLADVLPGIDRALRTTLQHVLDTGEPAVANDSATLIERDGGDAPELCFFNFVFQPLRDDAGAVAGIVAVGTEVTDSVRARREAERLQQEAETARQRIGFLAEAGERLARSHDVEAALRTVADLAVPTLADWCFVQARVADGSVHAVAVAHQDPAKVALAHEVLHRYPIDLDAPFGTGHVLRTGEPELVPEITDAMLARVARDAEHLALVRSVGFRSSLSVPIRDADGQPVAVLSLVSAEGARRFGESDLAVAQEVARRAEVALVGAALYAAEQAALRRATVLQRVTAALSGTLTMQEAAQVVVAQCTAALGARGGAVLRLVGDGSALEIVQAVGYAESILDRWRRVPMHAAVPLAEAARTRRPVFVESPAAWETRYDTRSLLRHGVESASWAALPLLVEERVLGAMGLSFAREGPLGEEDRAFAVALAQQCAQAFERARLFEAEHAAREEAERASRAKSEFLAVMSHELRTPLNAIGGYAELMEMGIRGPVTPAQREDLGRIQRSQKHLLGLINEVLNYARLESGAVTFDVRPMLVADAVAAAAPLVEPQRTAKNISLAVRLPELAGRPRLFVRADAEKLQQILLNLLSNAVKFTPAGGLVTIELLNTPDRQGQAVLRVTDTGIGIPADRLDAIFDPFVQVGRTLSSPGEGTGLGLAISRDLARGMGGDLTAESTVGAGSTFTLTLPIA